MKHSRPSQADVFFVVMNSLIEKVYVEDFIAKKMTLSCSRLCL